MAQRGHIDLSASCPLWWVNQTLSRETTALVPAPSAAADCARSPNTNNRNRSIARRRYRASGLPLSDRRRGVVLGELVHASPLASRAGSWFDVCVSGFGQMGASLRGRDRGKD